MSSGGKIGKGDNSDDSTIECEKKLRGFSSNRSSSNNAKSRRDDIKERELVNVGTEMYGLMRDDPRMRVRHRAEHEFKESDVPLIKAGYF